VRFQRATSQELRSAVVDATKAADAALSPGTLPTRRGTLPLRMKSEPRVSKEAHDLYLVGVPGAPMRAKGEVHDVPLSKLLSKLLRHGVPEGVPIDGEGWTSVTEALMAINKLAIAHGRRLHSRHYTEQDVHEMVRLNDKKRFELKQTATGIRIRATYKHTVKLAAGANASLLRSREEQQNLKQTAAKLEHELEIQIMQPLSLPVNGVILR